MEMIKIQGTEDTPLILLDKSASAFEISGRSLPEDAAEFYAPVLGWIEEYSKAPNTSTDVTMKLEYFNTASSKLILDVLSKFEKIPGTKITWYYFDGDEDMQEAGQEFSELIDLSFEFKAY